MFLLKGLPCEPYLYMDIHSTRSSLNLRVLMSSHVGKVGNFNLFTTLLLLVCPRLYLLQLSRRVQTPLASLRNAHMFPWWSSHLLTAKFDDIQIKTTRDSVDLYNFVIIIRYEFIYRIKCITGLIQSHQKIQFLAWIKIQLNMLRTCGHSSWLSISGQIPPRLWDVHEARTTNLLHTNEIQHDIYVCWCRDICVCLYMSYWW